MTDEWERGYNSGYDAGMAAMIREQLRQQGDPSLAQVLSRSGRPKPKSKKGKDPTPTLTKMTAPIWKRYKAGSGKKTYFDIRNQVRRSMKYKKAKKTRGA